MKPRKYIRKPCHEWFKEYAKISDHEYNVWLYNGFITLYTREDKSIDWAKTFEEAVTKAKVFYSDKANKLDSWLQNVNEEIDRTSASLAICQFCFGNYDDVEYYNSCIYALKLKQHYILDFYIQLNERFPSLQKDPFITPFILPEDGIKAVYSCSRSGTPIISELLF